MVTLKDIAAEAKLSVNTVSLALRGIKRVSPECMHRVQSIADRMGYKPNRAAQALRTNKSYEIAVFAADIDYFFHNKVLAGVLQFFQSTDYKVNLYFKDNILPDENSGNYFDKIPAGGLIIRIKNENVIMNKFKQKGIPYITVPYYNTREIKDLVVIDFEKGVNDSVNYLAQHGCKRIAFIGRKSMENDGREMGYRSAIKKLGQKPLIIKAEAIGRDNVYQEAVNIAKRLMNISLPPDGIQAFNDFQASGLLAGFHMLGKKIPDEISIIGFDDSDISALTYPRLTTVSMPLHECGMLAAEKLYKKIESPQKNDNLSIAMETKLVIRESA